MIRTDTTACSNLFTFCRDFWRREVDIRLWSGALLLLLDPVLVVVLSCLIWFGWTPCCPLGPPSWQPCSSSWSASGAPLIDHGHWLLELGFCGDVWDGSWCSWDKVRRKCCLWCVRLPLWCLSITSAQSPLDLLTLWSKLRLWCLSLFGHYLWLPTGLSDLANGPGVAMIRI
jgi:hypothetical protein